MRPRDRALSRIALAVAALALAGTWMFSPAVLGDRYISPNGLLVPGAPANPYLHDVAYTYAPLLHHARTAVRSGHLPAWDPYVGAGRPLGAQQAAPLFPATWPIYAMDLERGYVFVLLAKLLLGGLGMFALCRRLRLAAPAAVVGGLAFAFGNPFVPFLGHPNTNVFALLPWALLATDRLVERVSARDALLLGLAGGAMLYGGHPESQFLVTLTVVAYAVFRLAGARREPGRSLRRPSALLAGAGVVAALVGALGLLAFAEVLRQSLHFSRGGAPGDSLPHIAVGMFFPELWGRADKHVFNSTSFNPVSSLYLGRPYVGAVPVVLAAAGLALRPRDSRQWFFAALAGVALLIALETPLRDVLDHVPLFSVTSLHAFVWVFAFAVAVLAAYGVDVAIRADRAGRRRLLAVGTAVAGLPVAGWLALHPSILGSAGTALDQFPTLRPYTTSPDAAALGAVLRFAVLAGAALALLALVRGPRTRVALAAGAVALTLADVATLGRGYFPAVSHEVAAAPPPPAATGARVDRRLAGRGGALLPNLAVRYELLDARVQDLPELERYTRLWGDLGGDVVSDLGITTVGDATPVDSPLLDVFSVRHLLAGDPLVSIENPDAFPRAWFATSWRTADSLDAALERVRTTPAAQLRRGPVIEGAPPSRPATGPAGTARIRRSEDTRVEVAVTAPRAGYLILDDVHYPGWEAEVDGRAAPVRPANAAFRAVPVPAGRHVVVFRYRSATLAWGSRLSLAGLALVAAGLLAGLVRDRRRRA